MRGEVLVGPERRRRWSEDEKARIIEESLRPVKAMLKIKAAIRTKGARVIGFFHLSHLSIRGSLAPMSAWSDDAPSQTRLEMLTAYGGDASALSCLAW
jgi:hypothetical protein